MATPVQYQLRESHNDMEDAWMERGRGMGFPMREPECIEVTIRMRCTPDEARKLVELMDSAFGIPQPTAERKPGPRGLTTLPFTR